MVRRTDPSIRRSLVVEYEFLNTAAQANRVTLTRQTFVDCAATMTESWLVVRDDYGEVHGFPVRVVRHWWYEWKQRQ